MTVWAIVPDRSNLGYYDVQPGQRLEVLEFSLDHEGDVEARLAHDRLVSIWPEFISESEFCGWELDPPWAARYFRWFGQMPSENVIEALK